MSSAFVVVSLFCLYFVVASVGSYNLTVGTLCAAVVMLFSMRKLVLPTWPVALLAILLLWPIGIYTGADAMRAELAMPFADFFQSYALWAVSAVLVMLSVTTRSPVFPRKAFPLLVVLLAISAIQVVLAGLGSRAGYEMLQPFLRIDVNSGYQTQTLTFNARALATYYEPSMAGRVIGTLAFIDLIVNRKVTRVVIALLLGALLTKSLGLIVMIGAMSAILFGRSARELVGLGLAGLVLFAAMGDLIQQRISQDDVNSSTFRRTEAPLTAMSYGFANYPAGIPIGSMEVFTEMTRYTELTGEPKITNGAYEFMLYLGIAGIAAVFGALFGVVLLVTRGERELACALLYAVMATALSGSFLSIESSLLIYYMTVSCIFARTRRLSRERAQRIAAMERQRARAEADSAGVPAPA